VLDLIWARQGPTVKGPACEGGGMPQVRNGVGRGDIAACGGSLGRQPRRRWSIVALAVQAMLGMVPALAGA